jgi:hypothetical protein
MSLFLYGQYDLVEFGVNGAYGAPVQDLEDPNIFYFANRDTVDGYLKIYKLEWTSTTPVITLLWILGTTDRLPIGAGAIAWNVVAGFGALDTDQHYCFLAQQVSNHAYKRLVQVNLKTGNWWQTTAQTWGCGSKQVVATAGLAGTCFATGYVSSSPDFLVNYLGFWIMDYGNSLVSGSEVAPTIFYQNYGGASYRDSRARVIAHTAEEYRAVVFMKDYYRVFNLAGNGTEHKVLSQDFIQEKIEGYDISSGWGNVGGDSAENHTVPYRYIPDGNLRYFFAVAPRAGTGDDEKLAWVCLNVRDGATTIQDISSFVAATAEFTEADNDYCIDALATDWDVERVAFGVQWRIGGGVMRADTLFASTFPTIESPLDSIVVDGASGCLDAIFCIDNCWLVFSRSGGHNYAITRILDDKIIVEDDEDPTPPAYGAIVHYKDKRVFFIGAEGYDRYLWWGQPFEPQSLDTGWDGYNTTLWEDEPCRALIEFENVLYVGSKKGWFRLRGSSPDHWIPDNLAGTKGPFNHHSVGVSPAGALYPRKDGLWLFNGYTSRLFCEGVKNLLADMNWDCDLSIPFAVYDGRYFRLYYPTGSSEVNNRELIVDLIGGVENARATEGDRAASCGFYDPVTDITFLGTEDGDLVIEGASGSREIEITTKEFPAAGLINAGTFSRLHYDIDTAGATITITPIYDGVEQESLTLPATPGRVRSSVSLPKGNAFRVGIKITAETDADVKIYEPWVLE